jgi:beta-propeller repeat-containing protein
MPQDRFLSGLSVIASCVTFALLATAACSTVPVPVTPAKSGAASRVQVSETYGKLPLHFEANQGQMDAQVKFLSRGSRHTLFLTPSEAVLVFTTPQRTTKGRLSGARVRPEDGAQVTRTVLRMTFVGASAEPRLVGMEELPGKANYFIGNDLAKWRTNVSTYAKVQYENVYRGIDLVYYGQQRQLEYDFVVRPGANPQTIVLGFQGADRLEVDAQGDLVLHTSAGVIRQRKPVIYQEVEGRRREIAGGYVLEGVNQVGFKVAAYDASRPLVIDPTLFYSTYLGGSDFETGRGIAVDASGNAYVTGVTYSANFPTTAGAFQPAFGNSDAFVTKLNSTGSALVYSTYLGGGSGFDGGLGIVVDAAGNAYVTGETISTDFPTTPGAFQPAYGGNSDAFMTKLNSTGSGLVYSTYLGGSDIEAGLGVAVDVLSNAYVTGLTWSSDFPTTPGAFQATSGGGSNDAFVTKLDPTGAALVYSTYLGGSGFDLGLGIVVDAAGNAYVTGETVSTGFPTTPGAFQPAFAGPGRDAFVTKLDLTGSGLVYSTYLGGSREETGFGIAVDVLSNAYVTGVTYSADFPTTPGAFQATSRGGFNDAFVTKLNSTGSGLVYSTYLGGSDQDEGHGIAVDALANAYVAGLTSSPDFPTTLGAFQPNIDGLDTNGDAFVAKLNSTGSGLVYSSYLGGGSSFDTGNGIALDALPNPNAYVTGDTGSPDFPTTRGAFQTAFGGGGGDAFVAQITEAEVPPGPFTARVTGGGTIDVAGGIGNFHFIIQQQTDETLSGRLQYINHASGARVQSVTYTSLLIVGNTATFDGTCTLNGSPCTFRVEVTDNGEPGTTDTFTISYPSPAPTDGGTLRSGNILIRQ